MIIISSFGRTSLRSFFFSSSFVWAGRQQQLPARLNGLVFFPVLDARYLISKQDDRRPDIFAPLWPARRGDVVVFIENSVPVSSRAIIIIIICVHAVVMVE